MEIKQGTIINKQYEIINLIGRGASADVFLCKDLVNSTSVALKIQNVNEEFSNMDKRFEIEAKTMLKLDHLNIVKTYDYFVWNNRRIIVMEYLRGKNLDQIIKEHGHLSNKEAAEYVLQILYALKEIHNLNIMHRDLKPANIIIKLDNTIKLTDFGIVQLSKNQELTKQASIIGTIQYLAPEIFKGEKASPSSEMFSIGVLFYKMLTGVVPFKGANAEESAIKIINDEPLAPSRINHDIDQALENIVLKMIQKDQFNRVKDTQEGIKIIKKYLNIDDEKDENSSNNKNKTSKKWFFWS